MAIALSLAVIVAAWTLLLLGVEPVPTWFYVFVWYPTLVVLDELASRKEGTRPVYRSGWRALSLLAWSAVVWLLFEAFNFRLQNWYYVFLPLHPAERWAGITLSFATVLPALFLMARLLESTGVGRAWRTRPVTLTAWQLRAATALGLMTLALALGLPRLFFPLIWGAVWLLLEPAVYRRHPEWSLFHDIERGEWGRIGRLLLGGLIVGLLWECYNFWARGKWIYTVPWLEHAKLFEMPPVGFLGFPFFALEAWTLYHALCAAGVAVPFARGRMPSGPRLLVAVPVAAAFAGAVLLGMESWTIGSTTPRVEDLPGVSLQDARELRAQGYGSVFSLATASPEALARASGLAPGRAAAVVDVSRLVTLRGLGTRNARLLHRAGVRTVCQVARREPLGLWLALLGARTRWEPARGSRSLNRVNPPAPRPTAAEVGVWVRAARRNCPTS